MAWHTLEDNSVCSVAVSAVSQCVLYGLVQSTALTVMALNTSNNLLPVHAAEKDLCPEAAQSLLPHTYRGSKPSPSQLAGRSALRKKGCSVYFDSDVKSYFKQCAPLRFAHFSRGSLQSSNGCISYLAAKTLCHRIDTQMEMMLEPNPAMRTT
jgi:hypothetical protein